MPTDYPRFTLNRHSVFLVPQQPALDWLLSLDAEFDAVLTLEELRHDNDGFLVPAEATAEGPDQAIQWVEQRWQMLFEHFIRAWVNDNSLWPRKLGLQLFREWFSIEYHSMLWDLAETPLEVEDWDEHEGRSKPIE
ncbi:MAG: hypothetical protein PHY45_04500 [Rhodocyclaceae bacterium]|nr:hypothetical protein [Rhodocyclaceae bacterium]